MKESFRKSKGTKKKPNLEQQKKHKNSKLKHTPSLYLLSPLAEELADPV